MGASERRARQRDELRGEILAAARAIVMKQGYAELTMRRIADAVGYSPAAIYQYFENRDAIAIALMEQGFGALNAAFASAAASTDPFEQLAHVARTYVSFGLENPETYRLMFMEDPQITRALLERPADPDEEGSAAYAAVINPVATLAQRGQLRPGITVMAAADAFWVALHGLVSLKITCPSFPATPAAELTDLLIETLVRGMVIA